MGNANASMHRERHKSIDSTPNSPFRELNARDSISSNSGVPQGVVTGGGTGSQAFAFDNKIDTPRSVLQVGSSQEDDENQPYYTKPVGNSAADTFNEYAPTTRKRSNTVSEGTTSISNMSAIEAKETKDDEKEENLNDEQALKNPALPTVLRWDGGGKNVMISGTFSKWKPIPMVRSHGNFVTIIDLPEGDHQYKFCVDGEWKHDPKL
ncbi:5'-AMP-activated protein kinase subunit beta-like, partial [Teleopsis dalmanni]|uniref:5'-AMP-activated protein kinase subunit beta-like n=1 Tax=Teleopsis dalmanni TaxID=139649 RepID=UPI0018CF7FA4